MTSDEVLDLKIFLARIERDIINMAKSIGLSDIRLTFIHVCVLVGNGNTHVQSIADAIGTTPQAAGKTVKDMARLGYLIKGKEQDDARTIALKLDEKGRKLVDIYDAAANRWTY